MSTVGVHHRQRVHLSCGSLTALRSLGTPGKPRLELGELPQVLHQMREVRTSGHLFQVNSPPILHYPTNCSAGRDGHDGRLAS